MFDSPKLFAEANAASETLRLGISPVFSTMVAVAAILCVLFIVFGGYHYITSAGNPQRLDRAKKILRNSIIGFVVVIVAGSLVSIMQNAYSSKPVKPLEVTVEQPKTSTAPSFSDIVNNSIQKFIQVTIQSIGQPIVDLLKQFTTATPLLAQNGAVFNVWVKIVIIADVLFFLIIALIGFRIMSTSVIGTGEVDIRSLGPQVILVFLLAHLSIFVIDAIITVSNAMVQALLLGMSNDIIWVAFGTLIAGVTNVNLGVLLLIAIAIILAVIVLIYYLQRMIILYVGAVLSPLVILLWLLPSFRDFAIAAARTYLVTIFVLFVHVAVLMLAVSLFSSIVQGKDGNSFMTALLAIATLLVLLRTSKTMNGLALYSAGGQSMRRLGSTFISGASYIAGSMRQKSAIAAATADGNSNVSQSSSYSGGIGVGTHTTRPTSKSSLKTGETRPATIYSKTKPPAKKKAITHQASLSRKEINDQYLATLEKTSILPTKGAKK